MNWLIIGLGYAGTRFLRAIKYVETSIQPPIKINVAYVAKNSKVCDIPYYADIETALIHFKPTVVVVSVNDECHADVLKQLHNFSGFVICEKPFTTPKDDLHEVTSALSSISGFCFDLIERYSEITIALKNYLIANELTLIRANFFWGKDRINDRRPTCGVTSEVIHALDLIQHLSSTSIELQDVIGSRSDFSISGTTVLDSIAMSAKAGVAVVTGYSSFVNISRKREIDLTFASPQQKLVYATMIFDTPVWDVDYLRLWERTPQGEKTILEIHTEQNQPDPKLATIRKLVSLTQDVVAYVSEGKKPSQPFPDLEIALTLQKLLNRIEKKAKAIGPVKYVVGPYREFLNDETDLERLG